MQYDQMIGQMDGLYDDAVSKIRRYNGFTGNLTGYQRPAPFQGPVDYTLQISMLNAQQQIWQTNVLNAQREYDLAIARQQAEARRRQQEAEAERHRSSSFSSGSSSSSSWSSSSGDSGGSWGSSSGGSSGGDSGGSW
jgi:uncharacterized membrane protein YgcG